MPLYQYHCESCSKDVEILATWKQAQEPAYCPTCKAIMKRLISPFAHFTFKGKMQRL